MAVKTSAHSNTRNPVRNNVSESWLMRSRLLVGGQAVPIHDRGATDGDRVAVEQRHLLNALIFHEGAVGRTEVAQDGAVFRNLEANVGAADAGVVYDDVRLCSPA